jgi:hypothetical protein
VSERPLFEEPLDELLPPSQDPVPPRWFADPTAGPGAVVRERPDAELVAIGRHQKWLIRIILLHVLVAVGGIAVPVLSGWPGRATDALPVVLVVGAVGVVLGIAALVLVYLLASKLYGPEVAVLVGLSQLIPCVGLVVLLVVNARATAELRRNGLRVGLLGARRADLRVLDPRHRKQGDERMPTLGW